jgi:hypothetical protein
MPLELATPRWAAVALLVLLPLAAMVLMSGRARRVRRVLGLADPRRTSTVAAVVAIAVLAALLAAAAAQPVVAAKETALVRTDAQVFVVLDTSRSMLARAALSEPARIDRARELAVRLRRAVPNVPTGLASLTDRLLPHAFPTTDSTVFRATLARSLGVGRPPPRELQRHATTFEPLENVVRGNLFSPALARRVLVVLTDGEARETSAQALRASLRPARPLTILFVRFWDARERVFGPDGREEPAYQPDTASGRALAEFAAALGARVFDEADPDAVEDALRRAVGDGRLVRAERREQPRALAPYFAAAAFVPLVFLLWTRNRA